MGPTIFVDNAILVLLKRMAEISRLIGLATLLIAIPLLAIAWMLASNLSSLLILNERRKLGLMRLRGVPGKLLGQSLLISIGLGGLIGGVIGLTLGTLIPLYIYEGGMLSWRTLSRVQGPLVMLLFLVVGLVLVLLISRKLVRYATTISPLEASRRVAVSEATQARTRFGVLEWLALVIGGCKIVAWIIDFNLCVSSDLDRGRQRRPGRCSFRSFPCSIVPWISSPCRCSSTAWLRYWSRSGG